MIIKFCDKCGARMVSNNDGSEYRCYYCDPVDIPKRKSRPINFRILQGGDVLLRDTEK